VTGVQTCALPICVEVKHLNKKGVPPIKPGVVYCLGNVCGCLLRALSVRLVACCHAWNCRWSGQGLGGC
jgi:hypothetical protein